MCVYVAQKGPGEKQEGISWKEKQRKGQRYGGEGDKLAGKREGKWRAAGGKSLSRPGSGQRDAWPVCREVTIPINLYSTEQSVSGDTPFVGGLGSDGCLFSLRKQNVSIEGKHFFLVKIVNNLNIFDAPQQTLAYCIFGVKGIEVKNLLNLKKCLLL